MWTGLLWILLLCSECLCLRLLVSEPLCLSVSGCLFASASLSLFRCLCLCVSVCPPSVCLQLFLCLFLQVFVFLSRSSVFSPPISPFLSLFLCVTLTLLSLDLWLPTLSPLVGRMELNEAKPLRTSLVGTPSSTAHRIPIYVEES